MQGGTPPLRRRWRDYRTGLAAARHVRGNIYEVRAEGDRQIFRVLFATEGRRAQILLSLEGFSKKTRKTPPEKSVSPNADSPTGVDEPALARDLSH